MPEHKKPAMPFGTAGVIVHKRLLRSRYFYDAAAF